MKHSALLTDFESESEYFILHTASEHDIRWKCNDYIKWKIFREIVRHGNRGAYRLRDVEMKILYFKPVAKTVCVWSRWATVGKGSMYPKISDQALMCHSLSHKYVQCAFKK